LSSSCLSLLGSGIAHVHHHAWLSADFFAYIRTLELSQSGFRNLNFIPYWLFKLIMSGFLYLWFFLVLGFKLRAPCLQGRHCTSWATLPAWSLSLKAKLKCPVKILSVIRLCWRKGSFTSTHHSMSMSNRSDNELTISSP
jgi:hypothetical protein